MRDAVSLLDQLASTGKPVTLEMAQEVLGTATSQAVLDLWEAVLTRDAAAGLSCIHRTLDSGTDPRQFARQIVEYLRNLLLVKMNNAEQVDVTQEMREQMARHAQGVDVANLLSSIQVFNRAATEGKANWMPALPLEMALIETLELSSPAADEIPQPPAPSPEKRKSSAKNVKEVKETSPEPPQKAAQVSTNESAPVDSQSTQRFEDNWRQVYAQLNKAHPQLAALVNSARSRRLENNILTLGFPSNLLKEKMEKNDNLQVVEKVLEQIFNEEILVRCVVLTGKQNTPQPGVDHEGMVASALRDLGGEIVDIQ